MAQIRARIWLDPSASTFPESELPELAARPSTALCISGGGTRSTVATIGYLRGLLELGLLDRLRYTSAVSGGSWASIPFTFWQTGPSDDRELLGPYLAPEQLDRETLNAALEPGYLGTCAAQSFRDHTFDGILDEGPGKAWVSATGEVFLAPFGLYEHESPRSYTWSAATRDAILARQAELPGGPRLFAEDFVVARPGRPFPIVSAVVLGPAGIGTHARLDPVAFEFTPLGAGVASATKVEYRYEKVGAVRRRVGGGLVETFALGSSGPGWLDEGSEQTLTLEHPERFADLALAIGASSSAFASTMTEAISRSRGLFERVPTLDYWPPQSGDVPRSRPYELGDGGILDNFGLLPILARGVETIVILINSAQKLSLDWSPGEGSYQPHIDPYIPPYFGVHEARKAIALERLQVFPSEELAGLVGALQDAKRREGPVIAVREHQVLDNEWLGIRGGRKVRIAWVYLDRAPRFEAQLPAQTRALLGLGNARLSAGPFENFPNYKTIGANRLSLVRLDPNQIRLLANLCTWSILDQRELFEGLLR